MIDLHCHILPALDDGPETEAQSLEMAVVFSRAGYQTVVATPHMVPGSHWMPGVSQVRDRVDALNQAIRAKGLKLEVVPGMEIALDPMIPDLLDQGRLLPIGNTSCLLIEPSFQQMPEGWQRVIFTIQALGHTILLAHPERCPDLALQPDLIPQLIASGIYLQLDLGSFIGRYGKAVSQMARQMAANGWIHCLATDSHRPEGHTPEQLLRARSVVEKRIGRDNLRLLSLENPRRLLAGEPLLSVDMEPLMEMRKRPWWRFWDRKHRGTGKVHHE